MKRLLLALVAVVAVATLADVPAASAKSKPKETLVAPAALSPLARQFLKQRMARHGKQMLALVKAVLLLDHPVAEVLAADLASEPRVTRPIAGGEDDLNAALPEQFFVLQDQLRSRALALGQSAKGRDDVALAARVGELMQTCVSCHSTFLEANSPK